jgi:hypothetical protein
MSSGTTWVAKNPEVVARMRSAKANGLLYVKVMGKTNLTCDACGETKASFTVVSICKDKSDFDSDPMSGDVYIFGATCWAEVRRAGELA